MECIQFNTIQVDNYRNELCTKAKSILREEIPSQLAQLETILDSEKIRSRSVLLIFRFLTLYIIYYLAISAIRVNSALTQLLTSSRNSRNRPSRTRARRPKLPRPLRCYLENRAKKKKRIHSPPMSAPKTRRLNCRERRETILESYLKINTQMFQSSLNYQVKFEKNQKYIQVFSFRFSIKNGREKSIPKSNGTRGGDRRR